MSDNSIYDEIYTEPPKKYNFKIQANEFIREYEKLSKDNFSALRNEFQILKKESTNYSEKYQQINSLIYQLSKLNFNFTYQHFHVNDAKIILSKSNFSNESLKAVFISQSEIPNNGEYIICKDPHSENIIDFMKMIWESDISLIISLTSYNKKKSTNFEYCPNVDQPHSFSNIRDYFEIKTTKATISKEYENEKLLVRDILLKNKSEPCRKIKHLHLTICLNQKENITNLYEDLFETLHELKSFGHQFRILFHASDNYLDQCSLLLSIDRIISNLFDNIQEINIYKSVQELCQYPELSLKNENQYLYIYEQIHHCLTDSIKIMTIKKKPQRRISLFSWKK